MHLCQPRPTLQQGGTSARQPNRPLHPSLTRTSTPALTHKGVHHSQRAAQQRLPTKSTHLLHNKLKRNNQQSLALAGPSVFLSTTAKDEHECNLLNELHLLVTLLLFPAAKSDPDMMALDRAL